MHPEIVVLAEKLRKPAPRGLSRERLIEPIISRSSPPTALVVALAGAGKTTLLAQVAQRLAPAVAWYRATAGDGSAEAMVAHLERALESSGCLSHQRITHMDGLLAALEERQEPCAVMLDDLHEIRGTPAEVALDHFVQLRPPRVRVVIGSRSLPQFNLPKLRVSGQIVEIGNEDLRFRSWEVEQLLVDVYGEPLPPEPVAALTRKIGGWAAGLQLFHLATANKSAPERCQAVTELDGRSSFIRSYLARNVLAEMTERKRLFLTRTCTLGLMTAPLCDALLQTTDSAELLAELEESQLFTCSDDDGWSYRYHQVLQVYLEAALVQELGPRVTRLAYARSAALLEEHGALHDALRAFARAEDWSAVARLLGHPERRLSSASRAWEELIPADLRRGDPWFAVADARRQLRRGLVDAASATYRHAEGLLDEPAFHDQCLRERRLAAAWTLRSARTIGRSEQSSSRHWSLRVREAIRRTTPSPSRPEQDSAGPHEWLGDGLCALVAGDLVTAADDLRIAVQESDSGSLERSAALLGVAVAELFTGASPDPAPRLEAARQAADVGQYEWVGELAGRIQLALRRHDAWRDHDVAALARIQPVPNAEGDVWGVALRELIAGVAQECAGESGRAHLSRAAAQFATLDALVLQTWAKAGAALGAAWRGDAETGVLIAAAETDVRRAAAPGPQALLAAASALNAAGERQRDLRLRAEELARRCGFAPSALLRSDPVAHAPEAARTAVPSRQQPADPAPVVTLACFGGFRLSVGPTEVDLAALRPRARVLLRLLALALDRDVHREYIVDSLWPGLPLGSATRSLQVNVSSLRQALEAAGLSGPDVLSRHGDAYRLSLPVGSRADVRDLEDGIRRAAFASSRGAFDAAVAIRQEALEMYAGEMLPEDGPAEWVVNERERMRLMVANGWIEQARDQRRLDDVQAAIRSAQLSVHVDRFADEGWELLAELHDGAGNAATALRTRHEHARIVAELADDEPRASSTSRGQLTDGSPAPPGRGAARALV